VPSKRKKVSKSRKQTSLISAEIEVFRLLLLKKRGEIIGSVNEMEDEALKKSRLDAAGDLSSMPIHMADIGSDTYQQELTIELANGERKMLKKIDEALGRINDGTYGICQGTGQQISKARLEAKPWARYCVKYAEMLENGTAEEQ